MSKNRLIKGDGDCKSDFAAGKAKIVGIRPGEKLHEQMISQEDALHTYEYPDFYKILPSINGWCDDINRIKDGISPNRFHLFKRDERRVDETDRPPKMDETELSKQRGYLGDFLWAPNVSQSDIEAVIACLKSEFLTQVSRCPSLNGSRALSRGGRTLLP